MRFYASVFKGRSVHKSLLFSSLKEWFKDSNKSLGAYAQCEFSRNSDSLCLEGSLRICTANYCEADSELKSEATCDKV